MNLAQLIKNGQEKLKNKNVSLILLGPSGAGKSRTCGSFGVKTLYIHTSMEKHGAQSAAAGGSEILPLNISLDEDEKPVSADDSYKLLLDTLNNVAFIKSQGIKAIALDSATELENIIQNTSTWKSKLVAEYKGVKSYAGDLTLSMFRPILTALQKLQDELGIHYVMTCILNVRELGENGEILDGSPSLYGFNVATGLIQTFPDILIIGQLSDGEKTRPGIQLGTHVSRVSKDQQTKEIRKLSNFHNRITGADLTTCPDIIKPSLALVAKIKQLGHYPES